jgi:hypothetical protein
METLRTRLYPLNKLISKTFGDITNAVSRNGKKFRSLDITDKDIELLIAISDPGCMASSIPNKCDKPAFNAGAITNKALQEQ